MERTASSIMTNSDRKSQIRELKAQIKAGETTIKDAKKLIEKTTKANDKLHKLVARLAPVETTAPAKRIVGIAPEARPLL